MGTKRVQKLIVILLAFLILLYVGSQIYLIQYKGIITERALLGTLSETIQTTAIAVRHEQVINTSYNGVLNYTVDEGDKIAKGGVIAEVYVSEGDAASQNRISSLQKEIDNLSPLTGSNDYYASNPGLINMQIHNSINGILNEGRKNSFTQITELKEDLQLALNRKQLIVGMAGAEDYEQRISLLEQEMNMLKSSSGDRINTITAPDSGYFISTIDGFENAVDVDRIENISVSEVNDLFKRSTDKVVKNSYDIGKICTDYSWYLLGVFSPEDAKKFENIDNVTLDIPYASQEAIPAQVAAKNTDSVTGETAIVFKCSYMDSGIALLRKENIKINLNSYTGILVEQQAVHFADVEYTDYSEPDNPVVIKENVMGVYVKYGERLQFVQIFSDKTINGYVVCKTELNDDEKASLVTDNTIRLYDEVVTEGTDLHDGKLLR